MFLRATKVNKHQHIAYIRPDGTGITSKNSNHEHPIARNIVVEEAVDEATGQVVQQEVDKGFIVGEVDGHTHPLEEITVSVPEDKDPTEEEDLNISYDLWKTANDNEDEWYNEAKNDEEFYKGNQWDASDAQRLKENKRAMLVINEIKPKVDTLVGFQRQNRTDMRLSPSEQGDERICDIYNARIKNIIKLENYNHKESESFEDSIITGRGALQIDISNARNITGDIKIHKRDWMDIFFGEHSELDASDAEYGGIQPWFSMEQLKSLYPDKATEIGVDFHLRTNDYNVEPRDKREYHKRKNHYIDFIKKMEGNVDIASKRYRLIECQRRVYKRKLIVFNASDNFYFNTDGMDKSDIKSIKTIEGIDYTVDTSYRIRRVTFAGGVVLSRRWSAFTEINVVPVYCNKKGWEVWGKVRDVKAPQQELNKKSSQYMDIINYGARYLLLMSPEAFDSESDYEEWLQRSLDPTYQPRLKEGFQHHLFQLNGIKNPTEIEASISISRDNISRIMNINEAMLGQASDSASGVAMLRQVRQSLTGNEKYFDNLDLSKKRITKLIVEGIQLVDSPEKLLRLMESSANFKDPMSQAQELYPPIGLEQKIQLAMQTGTINAADLQQIMELLQSGEELPPDAMQVLDQMQIVANQQVRAELLEMLGNTDLLHYDAVVAESPSSPTMMTANFQTLSEMARGGVPIPPTVLISLMPGLSPDLKANIIQTLTQAQQAEAQSEQQKYNTEIQKTMIANSDKLQGQTGIQQ